MTRRETLARLEAERFGPPCTRYDPQLFDSVAPASHVRARLICSACPVVMQCLNTALTIAGERGPGSRERAPDGTWGGLLWRDGRVVDHKRAETWKHTSHKRSA